MIDVRQIDLCADILIIGGGIAGLTAAVMAKETNPDADVLIVEKQTTGYSGKANRGGGVLQYFNKTKPEDFVAFHVNAIGAYLGDQDLLYKYVSQNEHMLDKLAEWGARIPKNEDGSYNYMPTGPMVGIIGVDIDITMKIRKTAEKKGVRIVDKVTISDLLTDHGKIAGATGFSLIDGTFYVIRAKSVILATGSQNYRIMEMWSCGRGDGIAAAYRAGAEMRSPEFGSFTQLFMVKNRAEVVFGENVMYNAKEENITKNFRQFRETDINSNALAEWYKQMTAGNGPVTLHLEELGRGGESDNGDKNGEGDKGGEGGKRGNPMAMWDRPSEDKFRKVNSEKGESAGPHPEVAPGFIGEQSPVKVDQNMETTLTGLYAIGDVSYTGSAAPGAVPAPPGRNRGSGILNAVFAGMTGGEHAAKYVRSAEQPNVAEEQIENSKSRVFAPLYRENGVSWKEITERVKEIIAPVETSVYMSEDRLNIALNKLEKVKVKLPLLQADDFHNLLSCHEAEAMVICAEMFFKAALMRKESRGWFLREDYPEMDNKNWLKWIIVKKQGDAMTLSTEAVPWEKWPVKPNRS